MKGGESIIFTPFDSHFLYTGEHWSKKSENVVAATLAHDPSVACSSWICCRFTRCSRAEQKNISLRVGEREDGCQNVTWHCLQSLSLSLPFSLYEWITSKIIAVCTHVNASETIFISLVTPASLTHTDPIFLFSVCGNMAAIHRTCFAFCRRIHILHFHFFRWGRDVEKMQPAAEAIGGDRPGERLALDNESRDVF